MSMRKTFFFLLFFAYFKSIAQFKFIDTGEIAIYNEQIWKIVQHDIILESKKSKSLLYSQAISWTKSLTSKEGKWNIITEENKSILCQGTFEFLYNKNGSVSSYPALINFELQFEDEKVIFHLNELKTRYAGEPYDPRYPYDATEKFYSILTFRPYRKVGKKLKKAKDYNQMIRVEYYLNNYVESLSNYIKLN